MDFFLVETRGIGSGWSVSPPSKRLLGFFAKEFIADSVRSRNEVKRIGEANLGFLRSADGNRWRLPLGLVETNFLGLFDLNHPRLMDDHLDRPEP
jgi:hypothetical protein